MIPELSIIVPSIRRENWVRIISQLTASCDKHSFEVIFVSPQTIPIELENDKRVIVLFDQGSPARCVQHASTIARGKFIAMIADDGIIHQHGISAALNQLIESGNPEMDIVALRYMEGQNYQPRVSDFVPEYWNAKFHGDLRIAGIDDNWKICLMFLMSLARFRDLGGIDCRFEHVNYNLHDLAFRAQRDGSSVIVSKEFVSVHNHDPNSYNNTNPVHMAHVVNDKPLFLSIYANYTTSINRQTKIDYDNWKLQPALWARRL